MNNLLELRRMLHAKESLPEHVTLIQPEMNGGKVTREQSLNFIRAILSET